ncbi:MAG: phenylalanine--tRNA ligase subunit alpha [Thermoplasmata archaeon HGW-Thermoplasmata-1]|nr:MAG: phenylalanine--tRNA ligase subunit alpha [Thermoplasmata archaeon HGW-Thermoplasmata-1]
MALEETVARLSRNEKRVLLALKDMAGSGNAQAIVSAGGFSSMVEVMNASAWLQSKSLVRFSESVTVTACLEKEGREAATNGLAERRAIILLDKEGGKAAASALSDSGALQAFEVPIALGWLKRKGWADISKEGDKTMLTLTQEGRAALSAKGRDEEVLAMLHDAGGMNSSELDREALNLLKGRKGIVSEKEQVIRTVSLTEEGVAALEPGIGIKEEVSSITPELIKSGGWRNVEIRPYDVGSFAPAVYGAKPHPLRQLIDRIRRIFLDMGFTEIEGDFVESAFWNMDALFIPQDHPAREMQDTFYCSDPARAEIREKELLDTVASIHENGGSTGSAGWGYKFDRATAERMLLRTHTTVNTLQYLRDHPEPPCKVFSVGRVFRKESLDATHLPEFHQVEGIICERGANFSMLVGIIREFYKRMDFDEIRFRPAYFPYTEPSMEVDVFWHGRWMELGGSGIFRPEVTEPVGVKEPVLAWGLGLERLAMMVFGLKDIRDLYVSDINWLKETPLV